VNSADDESPAARSLPASLIAAPSHVWAALNTTSPLHEGHFAAPSGTEAPHRLQFMSEPGPRDYVSAVGGPQAESQAPEDTLI
jgi:hypothetical protein